MQICESVFQVGGGGLSDGSDCLVYLVDLGESVLIDCGAGRSWPRIADNIQAAGLDPARLNTLVLTHGHVDHIGAAARIQRETGCRVVAHSEDAQAIESGDPEFSVARLYGVELEQFKLDLVVSEPQTKLTFSKGVLSLIHTPGHTPGSLAALCEIGGQKVLFGQDIHGPFSPAFGSDIAAWRESMTKLLALEADILCEGHFGVFRPAARVREFIEGHLSQPKTVLPLP